LKAGTITDTSGSPVSTAPSFCDISNHPLARTTLI
jgi:hypothetical protein